MPNWFSKLLPKSKKQAASSTRTSQAGSAASSIKHPEGPPSDTKNEHREPRNQLAPSSTPAQLQDELKPHVDVPPAPESPPEAPPLEPPPSQADKPPPLRQAPVPTPSRSSANDVGPQREPSANKAGKAIPDVLTNVFGASENPNSIHIPPIPDSLPSQVDVTMDSCPRFRIVLIGNAGVGKSSLVKHMFNVDPSEIDVIDGRAGSADIEREYSSLDNPRFVLHDSMGFEAGSLDNWDKVERFFKACQAQKDLARRIHAIWFCLLTPRDGARLLEEGDKKLITMAIEFKIPIIAVFTKYDMLINQCIRGDNSANRLSNAQIRAAQSLQLSAKKLQEAWKRLSFSDSEMEYVRTSIPKNATPKEVQQTLKQLTKVTRNKLREVEGDLYVSWAAAQQVSARQKVDASIQEGLKKYWKDLGMSVTFEGEMVLDCVRRIHEDVLKVWNFRDPAKILSTPEFMAKLIAFTTYLIDPNPTPTSSIGDGISTIADLVGIVTTAGANALALPLTAISFGTIVLKFLYGKYRKFDVTAKFLATYIVNLVVFLHGLFLDIMPSEPPRTLSHAIVNDALALRADNLKWSPFVDSGVSTSSESIGHIIRDQLGLLRDG